MMMKKTTEDHGKLVYDSSLDYKGRVPLRSSTGLWKASLFVLAIEFSERLSYFALSANLITYLSKVMHQDLQTAVKNVNYWAGVTTVAPLLGGFLADSYTGRFPMIIISSIIYLMGLCLLTMGELVPRIKPCGSLQTEDCSDQNHKVAFFLAIYSISLGTGGFKPCLESFGADQFDDDDASERKQKMSYFNWWSSALCCGMLLGVTTIVYLQDYVSWGVANLVLTFSMAVTFLVFCVGRKFYRYRTAQGSPLIPMLQVIVAAFAKRKLSLPSTPTLLYEEELESHGRNLSHTDHLRFLDKAAIIEGETINSSPWRLATVTQVEELKLLLNMIPVWLSSLAFGLTMAQSPTFFVKQSSTMDRKISTSFTIPSASVNAILAIGMITSILIYDKVLVPTLRKATGNERGINILKRVGIGMAFSVLTMVIAALVERKRLRAAEPSTVSVFWLAPQLVVMGIGDSLTLVGLQEFFYDQVPDRMRSMGMAFFLSVIGIGSFLSSLLITIVDHVTKQNGKKDSWFGKNLKDSRLDKFYWLLAVISSLNLCVFLCVAKRYTYKNVKRSLTVDI
ncbi:protein NRT1/ PTR FAMILY 5.6-like [Impatiens glandulifera]|uniref:protein NRT1/ PTR FAMILY 5.6-like n=1 Tax=Impatiens glandulifera TaxID=253017 RepID=UPI001FB0E1C5|nr:protein NRT1/ PTR FAMILY 5.6-like [Impatiens glandulifera]